MMRSLGMVSVFVPPCGVDMDNVNTLVNVVTQWLVEKTDIRDVKCLQRQNPDTWGGLTLNPEEAHRVATVAVAKTAMKLKFLSMYLEIQRLRSD